MYNYNRNYGGSGSSSSGINGFEAMVNAIIRDAQARFVQQQEREAQAKKARHREMALKMAAALQREAELKNKNREKEMYRMKMYGEMMTAGKQVLVCYSDGVWDVVRYFEAGEMADCGAGHIPGVMGEVLGSMEDVAGLVADGGVIAAQEISKTGLYKETIDENDNSVWVRIDEDDVIKAIELPEVDEVSDGERE